MQFYHSHWLVHVEAVSVKLAVIPFLEQQQAGRASSGEQFSNALSKIRKNLIGYRLEGSPSFHPSSQSNFYKNFYTFESKYMFLSLILFILIAFNVRSDVLGQNQDTGSHSLHGEQNFFRGWILLGVIEVFINIAASELEKATAKDKANLEKEIIELVDSYCFVEKTTNLIRKGSGRKGTSRITTQEIPPKTDTELKEHARVSLSKLSQTRGSFFSTSSIYQLLVTAVNLYTAVRFSDRASQKHSQSSSCKKLEPSLKLMSFALKACLRHLKSVSAIESGLSGDPLNVLIYGDVKHLGQPLMQLVCLLMSGPKLEKDLKKKEAKGKKNVESNGDQLLLSLLCLNELFKLNSSRANIAGILEDLNSLATSEWDVEGRTDAAEGIHNGQDLLDNDPYAKSVQFFLEKKIMPLYAGCISVSFFQESEVCRHYYIFDYEAKLGYIFMHFFFVYRMLLLIISQHICIFHGHCYAVYHSFILCFTMLLVPSSFLNL